MLEHKCKQLYFICLDSFFMRFTSKLTPIYGKCQSQSCKWLVRTHQKAKSQSAESKVAQITNFLYTLKFHLSNKKANGGVTLFFASWITDSHFHHSSIYHQQIQQHNYVYYDDNANHSILLISIMFSQRASKSRCVNEPTLAHTYMQHEDITSTTTIKAAHNLFIATLQ